MQKNKFSIITVSQIQDHIVNNEWEKLVQLQSNDY